MLSLNKTRNLKLKKLITIITLFLTLLLLPKNSLSLEQEKPETKNYEKIEVAKSTKKNHKLEIDSKEDLKKFIEILLSEQLPKDYKQLNRAEQMFYDFFIEKMVSSYNSTDFSPENISKHLTAENIEVQREAAFEDYTLNYYKIEDELKEEIEKNAPKPDEFFDDDLGNEVEEDNINNGKQEDKIKVDGFDANISKNEL